MAIYQPHSFVHNLIGEICFFFFSRIVAAKMVNVSALYLNSQTADIRFAIKSGDDVIRSIGAHKNLLSIGSSFFNDMFYNGLELSDDGKVIPISDVAPDAVELFLRFFFILIKCHCRWKV